MNPAEQALCDRAGQSMSVAHQSVCALYKRNGGDPDDLPDAASLMQIMRAQDITSPPTLPDFRHPGMKN